MANLISQNFAAVEAVFEENGFSEPQAQGITAGLAAESNLDPSIQEAGGGPGLGLAQFTTGIQQQAFNSIGGVNSSATDQAQLVADELTGNNSIVNESAAGNSILGTSTPQGALQAFVSQFERPASNTGDITRGTSVLNQLNSGSLTGASSVDPTFSDLTGQIPDDSMSIGADADPLGSGVSISQDATGSAGTADFGDLPDNIFDGSTAPVTSVASGTAGTAATGVAGAGGAPINITDLPGADTAITGAGKAIQSGAGTIGSDVTSAAGGITGTIASTINSLETYTSSTFVVVALAVLGIVFVAFGLGFFKPKQVLSVL
jgi:hypothetical protein